MALRIVLINIAKDFKSVVYPRPLLSNQRSSFLLPSGSQSLSIIRPLSSNQTARSKGRQLPTGQPARVSAFAPTLFFFWASFIRTFSYKPNPSLRGVAHESSRGLSFAVSFLPPALLTHCVLTFPCRFPGLGFARRRRRCPSRHTRVPGRASGRRAARRLETRTLERLRSLPD